MSNSKFIGACPSIHHVYRMNDREGILRAAHMHGGFIAGPVLTDEQGDEAILQIFERVLLNQPQLKPEYQIQIWGKNGRVLHPRKDRREFLEVVKNPLSVRQRENLIKGYPPHVLFGACCLNANTNLPIITHVCQDPALAWIDFWLMGHNVVAHRERGIAKLPTMGDKEFLHIDKSIAQSVAELPLDGSEPRPTCFQKKINFGTPSKFVCVPGTHKAKAQREIYAAYLPVYPEFSKLKSAKTAFKKDKADPLDLVARKVTVLVPANHVWCWHGMLVHGTDKNGANDVTRFGMYCTGQIADEARYAAFSKGRSEKADMTEGYEKGTLPVFWPSMDKPKMYPEKWKNFPKMMDNYLEKMVPGHEWIVWEMQKNNGKMVQRLKEPDPVDFVPEPLTKLGKCRCNIVGGTWADFYANGGVFEELLQRTEADAAVAPAPMSRSQGKQQADADAADDSDSDAGAAGAGWKRKRNVALDSSDEDEPAAAPGPVGGAAGAIDLTFSDSDDDVIVLSD
jgi:hypothetical protein